MRRKLNLLAALSAIAELEDAAVSHAVMSLRFAGFGGTAACRRLVHELEERGVLAIERDDERGDRRQKAVRVTDRGWEELRRYALDLTSLTDRAVRRGDLEPVGLS